MKISINYSQLSAEFIIVVVGVAVALAADNWRQGLSDQTLEYDYIERLSVDLDSGRIQMAELKDRFAEANNGARSLLEKLELNSINDNKDEAIDNFAYAAMTGGFSSSFRHDFTYQELVSTGRLQFVRNVEIRSALAQYFSAIESLSRERDRLTPKVFDKFRELAGSSPTFFINRGETITQAERARLLLELNNDPALEREVRYLVARLEIINLNLENRIESNVLISEMLLNYKSLNQ